MRVLGLLLCDQLPKTLKANLPFQKFKWCLNKCFGHHWQFSVKTSKSVWKIAFYYLSSLESSILCFVYLAYKNLNIQLLSKTLNFIFTKVKWKFDHQSYLNVLQKSIKRTYSYLHTILLILFQDVVTITFPKTRELYD